MARRRLICMLMNGQMLLESVEMQRILVIDDDPSVASVLRRGLTYEGFHVDVAGTGEAGLTQARACPPDMVILDIMIAGAERPRSAAAGASRRCAPASAHADRQRHARRSGAGAGGRGRRLRSEAVYLRSAGGPRPCAAAPPRVDRPRKLTFADLTLDATARPSYAGNGRLC